MLILSSLLLSSAVVFQAPAVDVQQAFEAGAHEQVVAAAAGSAGLSYYQIDRTDRMAAAFETFLELAPEAPERGRVESVLRTLRGRR